MFTTESTNKVANNEPRVGGTWEIIDHREGQDYRAVGAYKVIDPPNKLVFTFKMPQFSESEDLITIEIKQLEQGCEMTFIQHINVPHEEDWTTEDIKKALTEFHDESEHGWTLMFDLLQANIDASF